VKRVLNFLKEKEKSLIPVVKKGFSAIQFLKQGGAKEKTPDVGGKGKKNARGGGYRERSGGWNDRDRTDILPTKGG